MPDRCRSDRDERETAITINRYILTFDSYGWLPLALLLLCARIARAAARRHYQRKQKYDDDDGDGAFSSVVSRIERQNNRMYGVVYSYTSSLLVTYATHAYLFTFYRITTSRHRYYHTLIKLPADTISIYSPRMCHRIQPNVYQISILSGAGDY